jgi:hypothetical protein
MGQVYKFVFVIILVLSTNLHGCLFAFPIREIYHCVQ